MSEQVVNQREVVFYGDELTAVQTESGQVYVSVRHMCDALGLNTQSQTRRIHRHKVLEDGFMVAKMATIKGDRPANWLRVDLVPLWLSGVSTKSVNEAVRPKLEQYQREAAKVLWEAFQEGRLTTDPLFDDLLAQSDSEAVEAYKMLQSMLKLARNQIMLEARLNTQRTQLIDHERRLEEVEAKLGDPERYITEAQATDISQGVRAISLIMSKRSHRNEYGATWGEFYRAFGVSKYRHLPVTQYEKAMAWLRDWYADLTNDDIPF